MSDLDDVLNGVETEEALEPVEPVLTETATDDLQVEAVEPAAEEVSTTAVEETKAIEEPSELTGLKAGITAERHKRQDLERQLQQMQQQQQAAAPKPDFWENPEGAIGNIQASVDEKIRRATTNMSVNMMRDAHTDYDEKESLFIELGQQNPALFNQMNQSSNPAHFAYNYATKHAEMQAIGDPTEYRAKIRAEVEAEFRTGKAAEIEAAIKTRSDLPGSLSNERASGGNTNPIQKAATAEELYG